MLLIMRTRSLDNVGRKKRAVSAARAEPNVHPRSRQVEAEWPVFTPGSGAMEPALFKLIFSRRLVQ
jgi:hypothetical protein